MYTVEVFDKPSQVWIINFHYGSMKEAIAKAQEIQIADPYIRIRVVDHSHLYKRVST
jgi:hypothetical protein